MQLSNGIRPSRSLLFHLLIVTRLTAAIVMLEVIYLKLIVWHDFVSPVGGIVLAVPAAFVVRRLLSATKPAAQLN